jgi:DsbC/DsbD-like thiol-disulfide interchange protein
MVHSLLIATLFAALPAAAAGAEDGPADDPNVTARLLPIQTAVEPGEVFPVGVHLTMAKGWHVYWKNPGEAGLPTRVDWTLPEGFRPGALQWPVPIRFTMPGDITAFGYAGEVVLIALITVPEDLGDRKEVTLKAKVSWLGCNGTCIPGEAEVQATLPVGRQPPAPQSKRLMEWWRRVPERLPSRDAAATVTKPDGNTVDTGYVLRERHGHGTGVVYETLEGPYAVRVLWKEPVTDVEWFPAPDKALDLSKAIIRHEGRRTVIRFRARLLGGQQLGDPFMEGVIAYTDTKGVRRGARVDIPLTAAKKAKPAAP